MEIGAWLRSLGLGKYEAAFRENEIDDVKSRPTPTPRFAFKNDPSDGAETGGAEPQIAEQSRSWRAAIGEQEVMRGS